VIVMPRPEIYFIYKEGVFDADHNVTDPQAKQVLQGFVEAFSGWVARLTHTH
jgi:chromate reductase